MKSSLFKTFACAAALGLAVIAKADTTIDLNPAATWLGFMNVFEIPANGGAYVFGSGWGTADLCATFSGSTLTLAVNHVNDPNPFWYTPMGQPGATGNKICDANMYVEVNDGSLSGQTVTFRAKVVNNDLLTNGNYTSTIFIKDFAPDYSSSVTAAIPLTSLGPVTVSLATIADPTRHVQYGFETSGPDVWVTDIGNYGTVILDPAAVAPAPVPITPIQVGSTINLTFPTATGFTYAVQYKTNLTEEVWQTLTTTNGTGSTAIVPDTITGYARFYKLSIQ
jgi:hypothetical protein